VSPSSRCNSSVFEFFRGFRGTKACEVLRSGDENGHRLRVSSRNESHVLVKSEQHGGEAKQGASSYHGT